MSIPPTLSPLPFVACSKVDSAVRDAHGHLVAYFYGDHGHMNRELFLALANGAEAAIDPQEHAELQDRVDELEGQVIDLEEQIDTMKDDHAAELQNRDDREDMLEGEIAGLEQKIADLEIETP